MNDNNLKTIIHAIDKLYGRMPDYSDHNTKSIHVDKSLKFHSKER